MSEFYEKYRQLFEEDEMSINYTLRFLMQRKSPSQALKEQLGSVFEKENKIIVPSFKTPLKPERNVMHSSLFHINDKHFFSPELLPTYFKDAPYADEKRLRKSAGRSFEYRKGRSALKEVYKNSIVDQSYSEGVQHRALTRVKPKMELRAKKEYRPEELISQVPTSKHIFPTPEKIKEPENTECKFFRVRREAKKHREKAKKMLWVIFNK